MEEIGNQRQRRVASSNSIGRCLILFVSSSLTQLSLFLLPSFFPSFSLLTLLSLSGLLSLSLSLYIYIYKYVVQVVATVALLGVTGVGRCCKRLVGVGASAPAFVFFNIMFIWGVYIGLVQQVISLLLDVILNAEFFRLVIGLCSILTTDPDNVTNESSHHNQLVESPVSVFEAHSEVVNVEKPFQLDMINTNIEILFTGAGTGAFNS
ncbi:hypothetical protein ACSBR1_033433 [Camellia fascicularis]